VTIHPAPAPTINLPPLYNPREDEGVEWLLERDGRVATSAFWSGFLTTLLLFLLACIITLFCREFCHCRRRPYDSPHPCVLILAVAYRAACGTCTAFMGGLDTVLGSVSGLLQRCRHPFRRGGRGGGGGGANGDEEASTDTFVSHVEDSARVEHEGGVASAVGASAPVNFDPPAPEPGKLESAASADVGGGAPLHRVRPGQGRRGRRPPQRHGW
jgi:hypothetical protein